MRCTMPGALALVAGLALPSPAFAQLRARDVERAVRIGSLVYEVAREVERGSAVSRRDRDRARSGSRGSTSPTTGSARVGARVVSDGERYLGVPYKWGGSAPREGFDCSGFVKYVYAENGVSLPRNSRQQSSVGEWVPASVGALRQGDLMFFASNGKRIDHVAMYAGGNRIIHSSSSGGGVAYDRLDSKRGRWYSSRFIAARRVASDRGSLVDALLVAKLAFDYFDPPDQAPRR